MLVGEPPNYHSANANAENYSKHTERLESPPKKLPMCELAFAPIPPKAGIPLPLCLPLSIFMLKIPPEAGERG
jgi:hypothetical protein